MVNIPFAAFYSQVGRFRPPGIKFLIGNFTAVPIVYFIPDWESEMVNQFDLQTILSKNWCCYAKMRVLWKKKTVSLKNFFEACQNTLRK